MDRATKLVIAASVGSMLFMGIKLGDVDISLQSVIRQVDRVNQWQQQLIASDEQEKPLSFQIRKERPVSTQSFNFLIKESSEDAIFSESEKDEQGNIIYRAEVFSSHYWDDDFTPEVRTATIVKTWLSSDGRVIEKSQIKIKRTTPTTSADWLEILRDESIKDAKLTLAKEI